MPELMLLVGAGLVAGFVGGLVGVGGGIIFAPVLFFWFQTQGVDPSVLAPLTIGTSLLCTLVVALASAWGQHRKQAVLWPIALGAGVCSAASIYAMTRWVTTAPWYDGTVFQVVFSLLLLVVVFRMLRASAPAPANDEAAAKPNRSIIAGTGLVTGLVSSSVGVGGGVVLVPSYNALLRLPIHRAVGTSSATIIVVALVGVVTYLVQGLGTAALPEQTLGYVDVGRALLMAVPAIPAAQVGVVVAHRFDRRRLRRSFGILALLVALNLLWQIVA